MTARAVMGNMLIYYDFDDHILTMLFQGQNSRVGYVSAPPIQRRRLGTGHFSAGTI